MGERTGPMVLPLAPGNNLGVPWRSDRSRNTLLVLAGSLPAMVMAVFLQGWAAPDLFWLAVLSATMALLAWHATGPSPAIDLQTSLVRSEEHHRILAESATDMITRFDAKLIRIYVSPASFDILGYQPNELMGRLPGGIVHADDWDRVDADLNEPMRLDHGPGIGRAVYRALRKDGREVWLESIGRRLPNNGGAVVVTRDVSERKRVEASLEHANARLEELSRLDHLTDLGNRRWFDKLSQQEHRLARRSGMPLTIILLDIDHFKSYNDLYGHPAGDGCLRAVAQALAGTLLRPGDVATRYGGEEFAVLLPATDCDAANCLAERLRLAVHALAIPHDASPCGVVTISLGVATFKPGDPDEVVASLIARADAALYLAKDAGRNRARAA